MKITTATKIKSTSKPTTPATNTNKTNDLPETARLNKEDKIVALALTEDECEGIDNFQNNVDSLFKRLCRRHGLSNKDVATLLSPYVDSSEEVSRIRHGHRHFKLKALPALFYVFGESIDDLLRFECSPRKEFENPKVKKKAGKAKSGNPPALDV